MQGTFLLLGINTSRGSSLNYREMEYDGIVLESWSTWAGYGVLQDPAMRNMVHEYSQLCFCVF